MISQMTPHPFLRGMSGDRDHNSVDVGEMKVKIHCPDNIKVIITKFTDDEQQLMFTKNYQGDILCAENSPRHEVETVWKALSRQGLIYWFIDLDVWRKWYGSKGCSLGTVCKT